MGELFLISLHVSVVLKDVTYTVMTELLQFMYQGVVNVKHTELNSFMKIAQALQIKGLATSSNQPQSHHHHSHHLKSPSSPGSGASSANMSKGSSFNPDNYTTLDSKMSQLYSQKRTAEFNANDSNYSKKHMKRTHTESIDNDISTESMDNISADDVFPAPQISMVESMSTSRLDLSSVKRESELLSSPSLRNIQQHYGYDYNSAYILRPLFEFERWLIAVFSDFASIGSSSNSNSGTPTGGSGNHMDIPAGKLKLFSFSSFLVLRSPSFLLCVKAFVH